MHGMGHHLEIQ